MMTKKNLFRLAASVIALIILSGCSAMKHSGSSMDQATINAHIAAKRASQGGGPNQPK